jgi:hypothetical protein
LEAIRDQKFVEYKEAGASDKLAEAKARCDPEYKKADENAQIARHKVKLLQAHLKAWSDAHESAQNRGHTLRKEMSNFSPATFREAHEDEDMTPEALDKILHRSET